MASQQESDVVTLVQNLLESGQTFSIGQKEISRASQQESDVAALVQNLLKSGKTFSISIGQPVKNVLGPDFAQGDGDCTKWEYEPEIGLVCKEHEGQ